MSNLLTWQYWFNLQPDPFLSLPWNIFIGSIVFLFAATILLAIIKIKPSVYRGFFKRLYILTLTNALLGLMFLFFNYEQVPFFSARFWFLIWAAASLTWLFFLLKGFGSIAKKKQELTEEQERKRYLP